LQTVEKGIVKGKELNKNIGNKSFHHFVQRLLVPSVRQQVAKTGPDEVPLPEELFKAVGETTLDTMHRICVVIWETGEWPHSFHFPRKMILNSVQITEQLLLSPMQTRSFFGSHWKGSE